MRVLSIISLLALLTSGCENYHKRKAYLYDDEEGRFSVGDCRVSFVIFPTRDDTKPNKRHFVEPFRLRLVLVIDETLNMEPPLIVSSYSLITPKGNRVDLLEDERLEFDLRKGLRLGSHTKPETYRRVTHYDIKDLPFPFDKKKPISIDIELTFGDQTVMKRVNFKPFYRSSPRTPLDLFNSV